MNRREREREFEGDVTYEVWRRGGDPDVVDFDRRYYDIDPEFDDPHEIADVEIRRQGRGPRGEAC